MCGVCDELLNIPHLAPGERARCGHCHALVVGDAGDNALAAGLALALAAAVMLICALTFPLLGFSAQGRVRDITLLQSATELMGFGEWLLGIVILVLVVLLPAVLLSITMLLLGYLQLQRWHPGLIWVARIYVEMRNWKMVEVYVIGVLVSLTKIAELAHLNLDVAFWCLLLFAVAFEAAILLTDQTNFWDRIRAIRGTP